MCLVALALGRHPRFPLVLASNRDEFFERPTAPLAWWTPDFSGAALLGGRDLQSGGTWLGLSRAGRLALVTNVREPGRHPASAPSRGALVPHWLGGDGDFAATWRGIDPASHNGFNLIAADLVRNEWHWASNAAALAGAAPRRLGPGVYGISNAALDTPWPKTLALKARVQTALAAATSTEALTEMLFAALADPSLAPDDALPNTGIALDWERQLSAAFIRMPQARYGTRCSTLVITERQPDGRLLTQVFERSHDGPAAADRRERLLDWPPSAAAAQAGLERSP
jgi:uncharacterized protein with NRDE domain